MDSNALNAFLQKQIDQGHESEWIEWKHNNEDPQELGEYISALANAAALHRESSGYIIWGIDNASHKIVGTTFKPKQAKKGNEPLESWLSRLLNPRLHFRIHELIHDGKPVVICEIPAASHMPVRFSGEEFVRVGSSKKKLKDYPEKERALWQIFRGDRFENGIARPSVDADDVLGFIDYPAFFDLLKQTLPDNRRGILQRLIQEDVIREHSGDRYDVTNLDAILFAKKLDSFSPLARKAVRIILYKGSDRINAVKELVSPRGYAVGFEGLLEYVNDQLPQNEQIGQALRRNVGMYPQIAIRELIANALVHQDFLLSGTGPLVEIFTDRIEILNPGTPLIDPLRFIDEPPQSRNEILAALMRRMNICEERGSGIDKVVFSVELYQLPAPDFQVTSNHTKAVLYAPKKLSRMDINDRVRACYQHACLCLVSNKTMTNATVRARFGISETNAAMASRIINETIRAGRIKQANPENKSRKLAKYVPFWA